jgi:dTDP-4-dehydrorhamnose 3,5-epimerase-like enzyme
MRTEINETLGTHLPNRVYIKPEQNNSIHIPTHFVHEFQNLFQPANMTFLNDLDAIQNENIKKLK